MDKERFYDACRQFASSPRVRNSIGTLGEKSLHAVLKWYYESDGSRHEIPVGAYVADIVGEDGVIEIQTRQFSRLRPKLTELLAHTRVTVVYPIIRDKKIIAIDKETGEILSTRRSPKHGSIYTAVRELYAIKPLLTHERLTLRLPVLAADEFRVFGQKTRRRKKQRSRQGEYTSDILPTDMLDEIVLSCPADYAIFLADCPPDAFTSAEYAAAVHTDIGSARRILNLLTFLALTEPAGKKGRSCLFRVSSRL